MKTAKEVAILLGISIIIAFTTNYFSPVGIALVGQWDTAQGVVSAKANNVVLLDDLEIGDISFGKKLYDGGDFVFVDARSRKDYEAGHIKGATSLPLGQFDGYIEAFFVQYPAETAIITYCSGRTCEDSHRLAQLLMHFGYTKINILLDGYLGWETEGYPIE
ncbi:MAG TPA: hypothetical protein DDW42_09530 [Desulfobacteraceae bacterium]|nr:hypothetical protein [Desulfobacteraceae bacterium]